MDRWDLDTRSVSTSGFQLNFLAPSKNLKIRVTIGKQSKKGKGEKRERGENGKKGKGETTHCDRAVLVFIRASASAAQ